MPDCPAMAYIMGFSFDMLIDRYSLLNQLVNWLSDGNKKAALRRLI